MKPLRYKSDAAIKKGDGKYLRILKNIVRKYLPRKIPQSKIYTATEAKTCTKCAKLLPISNFNKTNGRHLSACAKCHYELYQRPANLRRLRRSGKKPRSEMSIMSQEEKAAKNRANAKRWNEKNKEKKRARRHLKNPPKPPKPQKPVKPPRIVLTHEQLKANRKKSKRLYRLNNPENIAGERARRAARTKVCPHSRTAKNLRKRLKDFLGTGTTIGSFSSMVGCTKQELMAHIELRFQEKMSWDNYGEWHIDHIRPIASFDFYCPEAKKQVNHYTNLQPMWKDENMAKGSLWNGVRYEKGKAVTD